MRTLKSLLLTITVFLGLSLKTCGAFPIWPTPPLVAGHHVSRLSGYNDNIYFGAGYCLYRLDLQSRALDEILCTTEWTFQRPAVDGKRAYVQVLTSPQAAQFLVAVDISTGQVVWRIDESAGCGPYFRDVKDNIFLIDEQVITVRADRCSGVLRIYAFDKQSGQHLWHTPVSVNTAGNPFGIFDDLIWYVVGGERQDTDAGIVVAADPRTGRELQRVDLGERGRAEQVLAVTDGLILVQGSVGSESQGGVLAINRSEPNEIVWVADVVPRGWLLRSVSHGDLLILQDQDGVVYALDISSGKIRWAFTPGAAPPPRNPQMVLPYVRLGGKFVYGVDAASGAEVWRYSLEPADTSPVDPLVSGNKVCIATRNSIDALDLATGEVLWKVNLDSSYEYYIDRDL